MFDIGAWLNAYALLLLRGNHILTPGSMQAISPPMDGLPGKNHDVPSDTAFERVGCCGNHTQDVLIFFTKISFISGLRPRVSA